jgi:hypothetical protein
MYRFFCYFYFLIFLSKYGLPFETSYEHEHDAGNNYNFDYTMPHDDQEYLNKLKFNKFKCLELKGKVSDDKILKMSIEEKLEAFKNTDCAPVVVLPGFLGSKMEFRMKDCSEFEKYHPNIMKSCGWKNCNDKKLKKFPIWVNSDINVMEIMGMVMNSNDPKNKNKGNKNKIRRDPYIPNLIKSLIVNENVIEYEHQEECFGNLFRLYYTKNVSDDKVSYLLTNLKGAEVRVKASNKNQCGIDVVSNYLGNMFSITRNFQGFAKFDEYFTRLGYVKGVNLFYHPYDFRLPIDKLIRRIGHTVKTAYKITKKKPILIGHSLGGLLAYKFALQDNNSDLINQIVTIGSPFLGSFNALDNLVMKKNLIDAQKKFNLYGFDVSLKAKIDEKSMNLIYGSIHNLHFFPKHILEDEVDEEILKISEIEKIIKNHQNENNDIKSSKDSKDEFENKILQNGSDFTNYFYNIFPKPNSQCLSVASKNIHKEKNSKFTPICKINYNNLNTVPILHKNEEEYIIGKNFNPEFKKLFKNLWSETSSLINKNIHDLFHIETESFIDHIYDSQEKELFSFKEPKVPFTFIYSQHIDTPVKIKYQDGQKPKTDYSTGDGTVGGYSQIYPGLRWLYKNYKNKDEKNPIHFVEYCALNKDKTVKSYNPEKSQYISLSCDCIVQSNLNSREICNHVSMLGDTKLVTFLGDVLMKSQSRVEKVKNFENLFEAKFNKNMMCSNLD